MSAQERTDSHIRFSKTVEFLLPDVAAGLQREPLSSETHTKLKLLLLLIPRAAIHLALNLGEQLLRPFESESGARIVDRKDEIQTNRSHLFVTMAAFIATHLEPAVAAKFRDLAAGNAVLEALVASELDRQTDCSSSFGAGLL